MNSERNKFKDQKSTVKKQTPFAKKSFGQNFLVDEDVIEEIIAALNVEKDEIIVEIGSGRGALTKNLVNSGAEIIAVELERDMIQVLKEKFGKFENFTLIEADALKVDFAEIVRSAKSKVDSRKSFGNLERIESQTSKIENQISKVKVVANLPYYISTAILQKLIEQREVFSQAVLMLQREVVERIMATVGHSERGFLSVLVEAYCYTEKLFDVAPTAFSPIPKVWSSVINLEFREKRLIMNSEEDEKLLWKIVSCGFVQKRKTILNNLKNAPQLREKFAQKGGINHILEKAQIDAQRRAETLSVEEWARLAQVVGS